MATTLKELTFADGVDAVTSALAADGGVIVHDFIAPDVLTALRADMQAAAGSRQFGSRSDSEMLQWFWGGQTMRFTRLASRSAAFVDVLSHPGFLAVADALLLPNCKNYWLNTGQMMIIAPGQSEQILHRDAENWPLTKSREDMEVTVSCMFALDDFTAENGATRVVPGSHLWDDYESRFPAAEDITQAVMPAGSGMIYTGKVLHGAGANVTADVWRWGMHISFVLGWLVPEEASPLGVNWDLVRDRPARVQQLLGWRCTTLGPDGVGRLWTVDYEDVPVGLELS